MYIYTLKTWYLCCLLESSTCRSYEDPLPPYRVIADNVSTLVSSIQSSLKLGVNRSCKFSLEFRMDVFRFLFSDKGTTPPTGRGKFYELEEFSSAYFPAGWHIVYDRLGDGCRVDFPIRLESKLKWSSTVYSKQDDGTLLPKPRTFTEMIYVSLVKVRCR